MMMKAPIKSLEEQAKVSRDYDSPPLHLWDPALSGDIPIRIDAQGDWYHEDGLIERQSLVRLFASILRREEDKQYYLVTPGEKWRIEVELHPLMITDVDSFEEAGDKVLDATLNTGKRIRVSEQHPLFLDPAAADVAVLQLSHGLSALCTRAAWYRLVELAEYENGGAYLTSGSFKLSLPTA
jgi:hypothetical protein